MIHNDPKLTLVWANVSRLTPLKISCTNVPNDPGFVSPEPRRLSVADLIRVLADFRISTNLEIFSLIISLNIQHFVSPLTWRLLSALPPRFSPSTPFNNLLSLLFLRISPTKEYNVGFFS